VLRAASRSVLGGLTSGSAGWGFGFAATGGSGLCLGAPSTRCTCLALGGALVNPRKIWPGPVLPSPKFPGAATGHASCIPCLLLLPASAQQWLAGGSRLVTPAPADCVRAKQTRLLPALGLLPLEFQLIHGLDEGAQGGAKSPCATSNRRCEGFSIQATLSPDSFRSRSSL
jgi:hypothetical protein